MSKYTAIVRNKVSLPMQYLLDSGRLIPDVLDYGCGRGFDFSILHFDGYDPYWWPELPPIYYKTITCHYVLNVLPEDEVNDVIKKVVDLLQPNGIAYFTVRRDITKPQNGIGCIQRPVYLDFPSVYHKKGAFEIYQVTK